MITSHDAFGYFGAAYRVRFIAPHGWTTEQEPSARCSSRTSATGLALMSHTARTRLQGLQRPAP